MAWQSSLEFNRRSCALARGMQSVCVCVGARQVFRQLNESGSTDLVSFEEVRRLACRSQLRIALLFLVDTASFCSGALAMFLMCAHGIATWSSAC